MKFKEQSLLSLEKDRIKVEESIRNILYQLENLEKNNKREKKPLLKNQKIRYLNGSILIIDTVMLPSDKVDIKKAKKAFKEILDKQ